MNSHSLSPDECRAALKKDRDGRRWSSLAWLPHAVWTASGAITPGWVDRSAFPELPDSLFDLTRKFRDE